MNCSNASVLSNTYVQNNLFLIHSYCQTIDSILGRFQQTRGLQVNWPQLILDEGDGRCTGKLVGLLLIPTFVPFVLVRDRYRFSLLTINPCGPYGREISKIVMAGPPALSPRRTSSSARRGRRQQEVLDQEQYWSRQATLSARVVHGRSSPVPSSERGQRESSPSSPRRATNDSLPSLGAATSYGVVSEVPGACPAAPPAASTAVIRVPRGDYPFVPLPLLKRPTKSRDDLMRMCRDRVVSLIAADNKT